MTGQQQQQHEEPASQQQQTGNSSGQQAGGSSGLPYPTSALNMQQFYSQQALAEELRRLWGQVADEVSSHSEVLADFKNQALPLARIKKIMKSDEDVRMISAEAPVLFARACECFIQELTIRSWSAAQEYKRRTLQRSDIATAISRTDIFDFLVDIVPHEEANDPPGNAEGGAQGQVAGGTGGPAPLPPPSMAPPAALFGGPPAQQGGQQQQFGQQPYAAPPQRQQQPSQFAQQQQGGQPGGQGVMHFDLPPYMAQPFQPYPQQPPSMQYPQQ